MGQRDAEWVHLFSADLPSGTNRRFWLRHFALLFLPLLMFGGVIDAQLQNGFVPFDYPDAPIVEFQFDLDRSTIALIMEDADPRIVSLFNALAHLHLRNYKANHFDKILGHYGTNLKIRGWSALETDENYHLYTLTQNETVIGVFIIVKSVKGGISAQWRHGREGTVSDKYRRSVRAKTG